MSSFGISSFLPQVPFQPVRPANSLRELRERVRQDLSTRLHKLENGNVGIDGAILVEGAQSLNHIKVKSVLQIAVTAAGISSLLIGAWKAFTKKSPVYAVGAIALTTTAYFLRKYFQNSIIAGNDEFYTNIKDIASFRSELIQNGLQHYSACLENFPKDFHVFAFDYLSLSERKMLLIDLERSLYNSDKGLLGQQMAQGKVLEDVYKNLPVTHEFKKVLEACYSFAKKSSTPESLVETSRSTQGITGSLRKLYDLFKDDPGKTYRDILLMRFESGVKKYESKASELHFQALGSVVYSYLWTNSNFKLLYSEEYPQGRAPTHDEAIRSDYEDRIKTLLHEVLAAEIQERMGLEDPDDFLAWYEKQIYQYQSNPSFKWLFNLTRIVNRDSRAANRALPLKV